MKYKVKIKKTLIADNGKRFSEGEDISFSIIEFGDTIEYICSIKKIKKDMIIINNIEKDKKIVKGKMTILLKDIVPNSCDYVYYN